MRNKKAEMIQEGFVNFSAEYDMKKSFGFFIDDDGKAMLSFNRISDDQMLYMATRVVKRIADKHNAKYSDVLGTVADLIEYYA